MKLVDDKEMRARGADVCTFCLGVCCSSMRYLINVLVEYGEVRPTEKVCCVCIGEVLNLFIGVSGCYSMLLH